MDAQGLEAEMAVSDRLRAAILGTGFGAATVALIVVWTQAARFSGPVAFLARFPWKTAVAVTAALSLYEWGYRFVEGLLARQGRRFPLPPRLANTTVEISVPTLLLYLLSTVVPPETALNLPTVFIYFLFLALSVLRLDPWLSGYAGVLAGAEYAGLAWLLLPPDPAGLPGDFLGLYLSKAMLLAATGGVLSFVAVQIRSKVARLLTAREQQARMAAIFGQHVSPAVMEKLLTQKAGLETEVRHVTVLFLDIRNFTTFSEARTPDQVVDYLNRLFAFMVDEINDHGGIVNKFLGDGFMAVFGAPLDDGRSELNALSAALAISDRLKEALAAGLEPTRIGIGLHSGRAVTGNVGSLQRQEYTLIGDVVNLASRIESHTKVVGAEILVSRAVWDAARANGVGVPDGVSLGPVAVKGREAPVELVRVR
jgi:adenylate cyclase